MAYLIGTDEAGYGPNLGPLVVTAVVWEVPDSWVDTDSSNSIDQQIVQHLAPLVALPATHSRPRPTAGRSAPFERVVWGDSKALYGSNTGLELLENGVLTALAAESEVPSSWRAIWQRLEAATEGELDGEPWFANYDVPLPRTERLSDLRTTGLALRQGLGSLGVRIDRIRAQAVFPTRFNQQVAERGNKAAALSHTTLDLVRSLCLSRNEGPILVSCDKHGGRDRYHSMLQSIFPETWVETVAEGRASSLYRFGRPPSRVTVRFVAKGESFLPSALASMVSKYLRELAMEAFNHFWCQRIPNLRPTAGYPLDAVRFRADIQWHLTQLGIPDDVFWRCR